MGFLNIKPEMRLPWLHRIVVFLMSHWEIDKFSVNPGQCLCKVRLSDFEDMREKGPAKSSFSRITASESLIPGVESSFFKLANIEVLRNHSGSG